MPPGIVSFPPDFCYKNQRWAWSQETSHSQCRVLSVKGGRLYLSCLETECETRESFKVLSYRGINSSLLCKSDNTLHIERETSGVAWRWMLDAPIAQQRLTRMGTQLPFPRGLNPTSHKLLVLCSRTAPCSGRTCAPTTRVRPEAHRLIPPTRAGLWLP